jgi:7,8-dihydropterin-6-yl-methyl-4-(beta-D-ribofuranosyl)aminobenzene 5'-phosphate synthase
MAIRSLSIIIAGLILFLPVLPQNIPAQNRPQITVLYDNYPGKEGLIAAYGFSCLIRGTEKTILFDTGGNSEILLHNMKMLQIDPGTIDHIVISHYHDDHTGGLLSILERNSKASVVIPEGFPDLEMLNRVTASGNKIVTVRQPTAICSGVFSTGPMQGMGLCEQSLLLQSKSGLILLCGCSHPGIVKIIEESMRLFNKQIVFAFGGFHYKGAHETRILDTITKFFTLGVIGIGGSHCTGDEMMQALKTFYGKAYIPMAVGSTITLR